jgi:pimeloyl-ACP methyl ester carboxylesterase
MAWRDRCICGWLWLAWLLPLGLVGCGGGAVTDTAEGTARPLASSERTAPRRLVVEDPNRQGALRSALALGSVSTAAISEAMVGRRVPAITPVYAVDTFKLTYMTVDGEGRPIVASGLLAVPKKGAGARSPVISYQHGTIFRDAEAPSNNPTGSEPAVVLASLGYVTVAADYVGYGASRGAPHPYLLAAPTAAAVVDMLSAARTFARRNGVLTNKQLFLLGYSEGGYATAAAHRLLQTQGNDMHAELIGSSAGGGPLDVGATLDALLQLVRNENSFLAFFVNPDLLQNLGSSLRRQVRQEMLKRLIPEDSDVVFQTNFIDNFLANDREAIRRDSDVFDWRPAKPVRLFHGRGDQTVPFVASERAWVRMRERGAPDVTFQECTANPSGHLQCVPQYWQTVLGQMAAVARDL